MAKKAVQYYVVDAFTEAAFKGNPAAVCLLGEEKDEGWLQAVACEFNLSQTSYLARISGTVDSVVTSVPRFCLRWFTPVLEVKLCGHATLAASHILFAYGLVESDQIEFLTPSGTLTAKRIPCSEILAASIPHNGNAPDGYFIELEFPAVPLKKDSDGGGGGADVSSISKCLNGASVDEIHMTTTTDDIFFVLPSWEVVVELEPNLDEIKKCTVRGLIVTTRAHLGSGFDFVSHFFAPNYGINEDPVCGSAHCALAPYWSTKLRKHDLVAYQASPSGGVLHLHLDEKNERVVLRGKTIFVMEGSILV